MVHFHIMNRVNRINKKKFMISSTYAVLFLAGIPNKKNLKKSSPARKLSKCHRDSFHPNKQMTKH